MPSYSKYLIDGATKQEYFTPVLYLMKIFFDEMVGYFRYKLKTENRPTSFDSYRTSRVYILCTTMYIVHIYVIYMAELLLWRNENARLYAFLLPIIRTPESSVRFGSFIFFYYLLLLLYRYTLTLRSIPTRYTY